MNYPRIYAALVAHYRRHPPLPGDYVEVHHVVPRCLGGSDDLLNLVALPARAHFVAHQLLVKMHPDSLALAHAAWRMSNFRRYGSRRYSWLREARARTMRGNRYGELTRGKPKSQQHRDKLRGNQNAKGNRFVQREETKARISLALRGNKNGKGLIGRMRSPSHSLNISLAKRGRPWSEKRRAAHAGIRQ